jgi:hypothetical protein
MDGELTVEELDDTGQTLRSWARLHQPLGGCPVHEDHSPPVHRAALTR